MDKATDKDPRYYNLIMTDRDHKTIKAAAALAGMTINEYVIDVTVSVARARLAKENKNG